MGKDSSSALREKKFTSTVDYFSMFYFSDSSCSTPIEQDGLLGVNMPFGHCTSTGDSSMELTYDSESDTVTMTSYANSDCSGTPSDTQEAPVSDFPLCEEDDSNNYLYYQVTSSPYIPATT